MVGWETKNNGMWIGLRKWDEGDGRGEGRGVQGKLAFFFFFFPMKKWGKEREKNEERKV